MIITVTYSVIFSVTLHVLTVDTGRIEAVALITRAFISQRRAMAPPQTHDPQVKDCHLFYFKNADYLGKGLHEKAHLYNSSVLTVWSFVHSNPFVSDLYQEDEDAFQSSDPCLVIFDNFR